MNRKRLYTAVSVAAAMAVFGVLAARGDFVAAVLSLVPWLTATALLYVLPTSIPIVDGRPPAPPVTSAGHAEELAAALVKLSDAVVVADETGHVVSMSPVAEELTGWQQAHAEGRLLSEVCCFQHATGDAKHNVLASAADAKRTHASERSTVLVRPDGSSIPIAYVLSPMPGRYGARRLLLVFRDISAQVEVETALRETEGDFATLIERSPDVVVVLNEGRVVYANPAFVAALGYHEPRDIVGEELEAFVLDGDRRSLTRFLRSGSPGAAVSERVRFHRRRSGLAVLDVASPQPTRWKGDLATLVVMRNMTERIDLEQRLTFAERLAALGTLAAGVAHEINNPLSYILVNLEILSDELSSQNPNMQTSDGEPLATLISETLDGVSSIRQIVGDLSTYARAPAPDEATAVDVEKVLRSVATLTATEVSDIATLCFELDDVPPVKGNAGRLGQVVLNLVLNAVHALRSKRPPDGQLHDNAIVLRTTHDGAGVVVEVSDNGPGVDGEVLRRVFDPFFTTKPVGEGTGLGLAVCHQIVTAMGGTIEALSSPGGGFCVRLRLPTAKKTATPSSPTPRIQHVEAGPPKRVLIADDDRRVAQSIARTLKGYAADVVTHGPDALAQALHGGYDAIVCNVMMPDVQCMEAYQQLRRERPDIADRIIFLAGGVPSPEALTFRAESGARFLQKPIAADDVLAEVDDVINHPQRLFAVPTSGFAAPPPTG